MLWPHAFHCMLRITNHASSSGFGYVTPTRAKNGKVGSLAMLRDFNYLVCNLIHLFYPFLIFTNRIHACELHVPEMDLMSLSALLSLETKGMTIWKPSGQLRLERTACWALTILFPCLWSFNLKISFSVFSLRSEQRCWMRLVTGPIILSETSLICFCKCWRYVMLCLFQYSFIHLFKVTWIYSRLEYCPSCE